MVISVIDARLGGGSNAVLKAVPVEQRASKVAELKAEATRKRGEGGAFACTLCLEYASSSTCRVPVRTQNRHHILAGYV